HGLDALDPALQEPLEISLQKHNLSFPLSLMDFPDSPPAPLHYLAKSSANSPLCFLLSYPPRSLQAPSSYTN
ncbi:hypothetical protein VIGAN_03120200, partial [Vigna angularis var. angularis]